MSTIWLRTNPSAPEVAVRKSRLKSMWSVRRADGMNNYRRRRIGGWRTKKKSVIPRSRAQGRVWEFGFATFVSDGFFLTAFIASSTGRIIRGVQSARGRVRTRRRGRGGGGAPESLGTDITTTRRHRENRKRLVPPRESPCIVR